MANRETMETVTDFIFLGSKITADGDRSEEPRTQARNGRGTRIPREVLRVLRHRM